MIKTYLFRLADLVFTSAISALVCWIVLRLVIATGLVTSIFPPAH